MITIGDTFWKPPMLKPGQFDWWQDQFEAHVCSLDGEMWYIFENGPLPILDLTDPEKPVEKRKSDYKAEDYAKMSKNARARKVLTMALTSEDLMSIGMHKTAKDMYDALKEMYGGNQKIKYNRAINALEEYEAVCQKKGESLISYYSRFQILVGQLVHLDEKISQWKLNHRFLKGLLPMWNGIVVGLNSHNDIDTMSLESILAHLQSQASLIKLNTKGDDGQGSDKVISVALKVEKAMEAMDLDDPEEKKEFQALLTKTFSKFRGGKSGKSNGGNSTKTSSSGGNSDNNSKEKRVCYRCNQKGHLKRDCRVIIDDKKDEKRDEKKLLEGNPPLAMLAGCSNSDEETDGPPYLCLMAHTNEVNNSETFVNDVFVHTDFAEIIAEHLRTIQELEECLAAEREELRISREHSRSLFRKVMNLEKEKAEHTCLCEECEGREYQIDYLCKEFGQMTIEKTDVEVFKKEIEELNTELCKLREENSALKQRDGTLGIKVVLADLDSGRREVSTEEVGESSEQGSRQEVLGDAVQQERKMVAEKKPVEGKPQVTPRKKGGFTKDHTSQKGSSDNGKGHHEKRWVKNQKNGSGKDATRRPEGIYPRREVSQEGGESKPHRRGKSPQKSKTDHSQKGRPRNAPRQKIIIDETSGSNSFTYGSSNVLETSKPKASWVRKN